MSSAQVSVTASAPPPTDNEIISWKVKQLKEYVTQHTKIDIDMDKIEDKKRLQFITMDCNKWTFDRINNLPSKYRAFLLEKEKIKSQLTKSQIETYLNPQPDQTAQREEIINTILNLLLLPPSENESEIDDGTNHVNNIGNDENENKNQAPKNDTQSSERAVVPHGDNNNDGNDSNDDMSTVSTHDSMPSLMSDDESDESTDENDTEDDESDEHDAVLAFNEEKSQMKSIKPPVSKNNNKKQTKKGNKNDDWMSGFLTKGKGKKKQNKKKQVTKGGKKNKSQAQTAKSNKNNTKNTDKKKKESKPKQITPKNEEVKSVKEAPKEVPKEIVKEKKEDKYFGYSFGPKLIEANKDSKGEMFICIDPRKESSDLTQYKYLKCWISLKYKLKKKGKKKEFHFGVLIDLRDKNNVKREIARDTLKMGFENVLSFNLNPNCNILNIFEDNPNDEIKLNIDDALREYKDEFGVLVNEKFYTEIESDDNDNEEKQEIIASKSETITPKPEIVNKNKSETVAYIVETSKIIEAIEDTSYIRKGLLNECRLHKDDILLLLNDESMDSTIRDNEFYVRVLYGKSDSSEYRIGKIEKTMHYPREYKFMTGISTTKGFQISFGKSKANKKFSKISDDDFTDKEVHLWIKKMQKDNILLPKHKDLDGMASTLDTWRTCKKVTQKMSNNNNNITEPGSRPPGFTSPTQQTDYTNDDNIAPLTDQSLRQLEKGNLGGGDDNDSYHNQPDYHFKNYLQLYIEAINYGYHSFWCIPCQETDKVQHTYYIAFLLGKSKKNSPLLGEAIDIAMNINNRIKYQEIREWTEKKNQNDKDDYFKAKGWLFYCINQRCTYQLYNELSDNLLGRAIVGKGYSTNFCRYVMKEFGQQFMKVQGGNNIPKLPKKMRDKPQGPKWDYVGKTGEPSVATMSEAPIKPRIGEYDHSIMGDDDTRSQLSNMSNISKVSRGTNKTESKFEQFAHMKRGYGGHNFGGHHSMNQMRGGVFKVEDKVMYQNKQYEVISVRQNGHIMIENDEHSVTVPSHMVRKLF